MKSKTVKYRGATYKVTSVVHFVDFISEEQAVRMEPIGTMGLISITDFERGNAPIRPGWGSVLRLKFDDIETFGPYGERGVPFDESDAKQVIKWLDQNKHKISALYVHCWAGISRSAAVAKFIAEKLGLPFDHNYDSYNPLVYRTLKAVDSNV
jgi:predicted protein tyrosine phosphatase